MLGRLGSQVGVCCNDVLFYAQCRVTLRRLSPVEGSSRPTPSVMGVNVAGFDMRGQRAELGVSVQ